MSAVFGKKIDKDIPYDLPGDEIDAKAMVKAYHCNSKKLRTLEGKTLRALVVDKATIDYLANLENVKEYMILFAVSEEDVNEPEDQQRFTTILAAIDNNNKIMVNHLRNKFKPCPTDCYNYEEVFDDIPGQCQD